MSDRKRGAPQDSQNGDTPTKKARTEATPSAPASAAGQSLQDKAAAMRAQVAAKFAKFQRPNQPGAPAAPAQQNRPTPSGSGQSVNTSNIARQIAEGRRRLEEAARAKQQATSTSNPYLVSSMKRNSHRQRLTDLEQGGGQGGSQAIAAARAKALADQANDKPGTGIHPLLMDMGTTATPTSSKDRYKPMLPKFASTQVRIFYIS